MFRLLGEESITSFLSIHCEQKPDFWENSLKRHFTNLAFSGCFDSPSLTRYAGSVGVAQHDRV